jgi:hypothetical protein
MNSGSKEEIVVRVGGLAFLAGIVVILLLAGYILIRKLRRSPPPDISQDAKDACWLKLMLPTGDETVYEGKTYYECKPPEVVWWIDSDGEVSDKIVDYN